MLGLIRPQGVAPERMPKAEATTGLAPKKASATSPLLAAAKPLAEGFGFRKKIILSLVESLRSGGLGLYNAEDRRAGFARRSFCLWPLPLHSAAGIGNPNGLSQARSRLLEEVFHPVTFLARFARRWLRGIGAACGRLRFPWLRTAADAQILALKVHVDGPVQPFLNLHLALTQPHPHIPAVDLIELTVVTYGVVVGDFAPLDVTENGGQIMVLS